MRTIRVKMIYRKGGGKVDNIYITGLMLTHLQVCLRYYLSAPSITAVLGTKTSHNRILNTHLSFFILLNTPLSFLILSGTLVQIASFSCLSSSLPCMISASVLSWFFVFKGFFFSLMLLDGCGMVIDAMVVEDDPRSASWDQKEARKSNLLPH